MKNIVIDTNILYQEGLSSGRMKILAKLVTEGVLTVYVPEIVKREFITKRVSEITNAITNIQSNIKTISRKTENNGEFRDKIISFESALPQLKQDVENQVVAEFNQWEKLLLVKVLEFNPVHIHKVLDDYFVGSGAFKLLKNRDDFPDSMIHHTINELTEKIGELYLVLSDGAFKKGIKGQKSVITLNSLNDLLQLEEIEQYLSNQQLNEYFIGWDFSTYLLNYLKEEKQIIEQIYLEDRIENTDCIGVDFYNAQLNFPDHEHVSELSISNFYKISDTEFTAEISFNTYATLSYVCDYGSFLELEKDPTRNIEISSMNGDGWCEVLELVGAQYKGSINLSFLEKQSFESIKSITKNLVQDDSLLCITLDINSACITWFAG
jgi:predicted nucleic acid-binding protein